MVKGVSEWYLPSMLRDGQYRMCLGSQAEAYLLGSKTNVGRVIFVRSIPMRTVRGISIREPGVHVCVVAECLPKSHLTECLVPIRRGLTLANESHHQIPLFLV